MVLSSTNASTGVITQPQSGLIETSRQDRRFPGGARNAFSCDELSRCPLDFVIDWQ